MATHTISWSSDGYNGLMDWLGKDKGTTTWAHPENTRSLVETSQSSTHSGMTSDRALDQTTGTASGRAHTTNGSQFEWWQVKIIDATITPTHFGVRSQNHSNGMETKFNIEGSLDGVSWDVLAQTATKVTNNNWYSVSISGAGEYQYFRIMRYETSAHLIIGEVEIWGTYDDGTVPNPGYSGEAEFAYNSEGGHNGLINWLGQNKVVGTTYANPDTNSGGGVDLVTTSMSTKQSSYHSYNAFNRNAADAGRAHTTNVANSWWKIDFLSGNTFVPSGVAFQAASSSSSPELRNFKIEGSNNDSTWTELYDVPDSSTGPSNSYGWFVADLSSVTEAYRYIRVLQYGNNDEGSDFLSIAEIELYGVYNPYDVGDFLQMSADVDNATSVSVSTTDGQPNTWSVPASGNLLIAMVWSGGGTITNPSGWTLRYSHTSDSNNKRYIYEKVSDGTETGLTVSFSTTENHGLALYEVYGEPTWDTGTSGYTSSGTSVASGSSGTLSSSVGIAIALSHHWAVSDTSFDSSFTLDADYDGGNNGALYYLGAGHLDLTSTTAINVTSSWTGTSAGTTTLGVWIVDQDRELAATIAASSTDTFGLVQTNQLAGSL